MNKYLATFALLAIVGIKVQAQNQALPQAAKGCALLVRIDGFRNDRGVAGGTIFKSADGWPENNIKAFVLGHSSISGDHALLRFENLPPGRYAVAVLHDENSNKKLDRNFLRVPKEGFGFANNPHVSLSAPSFDAAAVNVVCPQTAIEIRLIYK